MPKEELLTAQELADFLRIPVWSAWRLGRERRVPGVVRVGRFLRFERAAIEAWVAQGGSLADSEHESPVAA
jgi:predicted DNA-binding transcriptional regulator AlpA